jgi:hypothetical protein
MLYNHPYDMFGTGTRVFMLVSRNKDEATSKRLILRVTSSQEAFEKMLLELHQMLNINERIYASACPRDLKKASRAFKQAQLDAEYDENPLNFYEHLNSRWVHALSLEKSADKLHKLWMFDCDSQEDYHLVKNTLTVPTVYEYPTKNGYHVFTKPFDRSKLSSSVQTMLHTNPMMLWSYK